MRAEDYPSVWQNMELAKVDAGGSNCGPGKQNQIQAGRCTGYNCQYVSWTSAGQQAAAFGLSQISTSNFTSTVLSLFNLSRRYMFDAWPSWWKNFDNLSASSRMDLTQDRSRPKRDRPPLSHVGAHEQWLLEVIQNKDFPALWVQVVQSITELTARVPRWERGPVVVGCFCKSACHRSVAVARLAQVYGRTGILVVHTGSKSSWISRKLCGLVGCNDCEEFDKTKIYEAAKAYGVELNWQAH